MKKIYSIALLAIMAFCAISFSSCGKDDDNTPSSSDKTTYAYSKFVTNCRFSEDMFEAFDVKIEATNYDGQTKTITIGKSSCTSDNNALKYNNFIETDWKDATMKLHYSITPKSSFTPVEGKTYTFYYLILDEAGAFTEDGTVISHTNVNNVRTGVEVSCSGEDLKAHPATLTDMSLDITRVCTVSNTVSTIETQK